jgi:hypothetical protein
MVAGADLRHIGYPSTTAAAYIPRLIGWDITAKISLAALRYYQQRALRISLRIQPSRLRTDPAGFADHFREPPPIRMRDGPEFPSGAAEASEVSFEASIIHILASCARDYLRVFGPEYCSFVQAGCKIRLSTC